jgi:hypothetical protein
MLREHSLVVVLTVQVPPTGTLASQDGLAVAAKGTISIAATPMTTNIIINLFSIIIFLLLFAIDK